MEEAWDHEASARPTPPAQDCLGEGGAAERASPARLRVRADAK